MTFKLIDECHITVTSENVVLLSHGLFDAPKFSGRLFDGLKISLLGCSCLWTNRSQASDPFDGPICHVLGGGFTGAIEHAVALAS